MFSIQSSTNLLLGNAYYSIERIYTLHMPSASVYYYSSTGKRNLAYHQLWPN